MNLKDSDMITLVVEREVSGLRMKGVIEIGRFEHKFRKDECVH